jgi:hypothetical protein
MYYSIFILETKMDSLQKYEKYKNDKKLAKIIAKTEKDIEKHRLSLSEKAMQRIQSAKDRAKSIQDKKLSKYVRKKDRWLNQKIRSELGRKPLKQKMPDLGKIKNKAHSAVQKYAKLSKADKDGYVLTVDTKERLKRNDPKVQAGHHRPKQKYPHMAFDIDNIYPITAWNNKRQGDMIGYERKDNLIALIGQDLYDRLESKANNKSLKNQVRQHQYYQTMYETYNNLNLQLLEKL